MAAPSPRSRLLLAGALLLVLLAQAGVSLFALWRSERAEARSAAALESAVAGLDALRDAQAAFGREVQEWKNVLLRGADPALLARHDAARLEAATRLGAALEAASATGIAPEGRIAALAAAHAALGRAYAAALAGRDLAQPGQQAAADAAVRGADRSLAAELDRAAEGFATHYAATQRAARAAAADRHAALRLALLGASAAAAVLAVALLALLLRAR